MTVLAFDWNATRVRAVLGPEGASALPVPLEPPAHELPLMIALDESAPVVGMAALRRSRSAGHQVCEAFLPYLTEKPGHGPRWQAGKHALDAHAACDLIWRKLHSLAANAQGIVLAVPDYFRAIQAETLRKLGERLRMPILGSMPLALAAASAGRLPAFSGGAAFWQRSVLVLDVDEHALSLGWVKSLSDRAHLVESRSFPHLGLRFWREKLIDALSDRFVLEHRRDPRDAPLAEQSLFDQLDGLTEAALNHRAVQLGVQGREWFKHLLVQPDQTIQFCRSLAGKVIGEVEHLAGSWPSAEWPPSVLLTHAAGRLPGLVEALRSLPLVNPSAETRLPQMKATAFDDLDYGENLLIHDDEPTIAVRVLPAEAPAVAAHALSAAFRKGELPRGHLETIVPLVQESGVKSQGPGVRGLGLGI